MTTSHTCCKDYEIMCIDYLAHTQDRRFIIILLFHGIYWPIYTPFIILGSSKITVEAENCTMVSLYRETINHVQHTDLLLEEKQINAF